MSKIGVVIPVLNNFQGALDLIDSAKSIDHELKFYIEQQYAHRKPLAGAWNDGFDRAAKDGCKYILICNDDILFAPETIDYMVQEYKRLKSEKVILICANNIVGQLNRPEDILTMSQNYAPGEVNDHPSYACFLVEDDFFTKVGRFDENFWPAWCEDQDSHQRIVALGYRAVSSTAAAFVHIGQVTTNLLGNNDSSQSVNYFIRKWGSHNPTPPQAYAHPYNDPNLSPKEWIKQ